MAKTANEELFDGLLRHQIFLMRYSGFIRNQVNDLLNATERDMVGRILSTTETSGITSTVEAKRLTALQKSIVGIRNSAWTDANTLMIKEMTDLAVAEPRNFQAIMNTVSPVQLTTVLPTPTMLRSIALSRPFEGRTLRGMVKNMQADDLRRVTNAIRVGMVQGETMSTIARRVVGTKALKGADGVTQITRRQVQTVTRTAVQNVANQARREFLLDNSDVILKERYVATLDGRTTAICSSLDGELFKIAEGPYPPLHFNCRSLRIAAFDSSLLATRPAKPATERTLLAEFTKSKKLDAVTKRGDLPRGTKGAYDEFQRKRIRQLTGPVPGKETYNTWLRKQPVAFQEDVMGVTKAKLYREGNLELKKFVNRNGDELPLSLLAQKHADAFRAAGLDPESFF